MNGKKGDEEMMIGGDPAEVATTPAGPVGGTGGLPAGRRRRWGGQPRAQPRELIQWCHPVWKRWAWCTSLSTILLIIIIMLAISLRKLKSTEYGIQYNTLTKKLDDAAQTGGLHVGPPGYEFIKFPSTYISVDLPDGICVSQDGLQVQFSVTFQYQMPAAWLTMAILKFRDFHRWTQLVEAAGSSAVQHSCSAYTISNFQNKRGAIQATMEDNLRLKLEGSSGEGSDGVYARAISLQLRNIDLPELYQAAIAEKQTATEDIVLAQNQRIQETTKAQTTLLAAMEEAKIINNTAVNDADILLTEATISAQEVSFAYETEAGVIVLVKNSLNLTIDGVLAYMSNRLYEKASLLKVSAAEPARLSRKDEL